MHVKYALLLLLLPVVMPATAQQTTDTLTEDHAGKSVKNFSKVVGWGGATPKAPKGFTVTKYTDALESPRKLYVLPNGDVLVAEASTINSGVKKVGADIMGAGKAESKHVSPNKIILLRDTKGTGTPDMQEVFLENLNRPFGMLVLEGYLYIANTDGIFKYPYQAGQTKMAAQGVKIADLQGDGRHWTRHIIADPDGNRLYVGIGSGTNIAEHGMDKEQMRACIISMNKDGSDVKVFASGVRNAAGFQFLPGTHTLWADVNERDELGDHLVPDYLTSVKENGFYGWPYSYFGSHIDSRVKDPDMSLVNKAIVPEKSLGNHVAPLGMLFYTGKSLPAHYHGGAFIAEHGSWNSTMLTGYKVVYVPFSNGKPGKQEDFLTGFTINNKDVHGRPVDVAMLADGSLLVSDDASNTIWRVTANQHQK